MRRRVAPNSVGHARRIRTATFRRRRYIVEWRKPDAQTDGDCDPPHVVAKRIRIAPSLSGVALLETIVHECLHACWFDLDEASVTEAARDIALALSRVGYRL